MPNFTAADGTTVVASFAVADLTDSQIAGVLSTALAQKWGKAAYLRDTNRAQGNLTFDKYSLDASGYRNWDSAQLHRVTFEIGDNYEVTFGTPEAVIPVTTYEVVGEATAAFTVVEEEGTYKARFAVSSPNRYEKNGYAVYPDSLLFRAGSYPDKKFSMSTAELEAAAGLINASQDPLSGNIQHTDFLAGKAAFVDKAWTEDSGNVLRGVVRVPLALDALIDDNEKGISMEWNIAGKFAEGFALCTNPRIADAALMSNADLVALNGGEPAAAAAANETTAAGTETPTETSEESTTVAAASETAKPSAFARFMASAKAWFADAGLPTEEAAPAAAAPAAVDPALALAQKEAIVAKATAFAAAEELANRCTPAERPGLIAEYAQAAEDDAARPVTVSFTATDNSAATGSRVDALVARQARRVPVDFTAEQLGDGGGKVLFNNGDGAGSASSGVKVPNSKAIYDKRRKQTSR